LCDTELAALAYVVILEHTVDECLLWDPSGLAEPEGVLAVPVIYDECSVLYY